MLRSVSKLALGLLVAGGLAYAPAKSEAGVGVAVTFGNGPGYYGPGFVSPGFYGANRGFYNRGYYGGGVVVAPRGGFYGGPVYVPPRVAIPYYPSGYGSYRGYYDGGFVPAPRRHCDW